ncbi:MAG: glycosyltransferase [Polyangiaceae bacterium]|nr:glycosyltransferase [Polyangiaceae bacterium]
MSARPLLTLVMIVKNEARSIRATIASARPHVDRYLILDTGSTDGTQALIREAFEGTPGAVAEEPFVDFGTSRNRALELAGAEAVFTLMLSGDETLHHGEALRAFCERHRDAEGPEHGAYYVKILFGATHYDSARLARADHGWRYVGVTHEVLAKDGVPPPTLRVPDAHILHDLSHRDAASSRRRWELDLELLTEEAKRRPADTRTRFYLAQTLECLGDMEAAHAAYQERIEMGGWREEVYESMFRLGRVAQALGRPWPECQQRYLEAHAHSPERAEPLFAIAWHYYEQKSWPLTYLFAARGAQIPYPEGATLFVDAEVYRTKLLDLVGTAAYYVGEREAGEAAIRKALARSPGDPRLLRNLSFYESR